MGMNKNHYISLLILCDDKLFRTILYFIFHSLQLFLFCSCELLQGPVKGLSSVNNCYSNEFLQTVSLSLKWEVNNDFFSLFCCWWFRLLETPWSHQVQYVHMFHSLFVRLWTLWDLVCVMISDLSTLRSILCNTVLLHITVSDAHIIFLTLFGIIIWEILEYLWLFVRLTLLFPPHLGDNTVYQI